MLRRPASATAPGPHDRAQAPVGVLHVRDSKGLYGAERVILTLAGNADSARFRPMLLCLRDPSLRSRPLEARAAEAGIEVRGVEVRGKIDLDAIGRIRRAIVASGAAIVQTHDYKSDMYAVLATRGLGLRRVVTVHGSTRETARKRLYLGLTERVFYRHFDRIVPVSERLAESLAAQGHPAGRITVIQNGFDPALLEERPGEPGLAGPPASFAVAGRLFPDKGHDFFLEALARVAQSRPEVTALIVGDGPARSGIQSRIAALGLGGRVTLCGVRSDMPAVYRAATSVVIPSLREGLPYVLLEALWYRKPVVATAVGEIPALVRDGETGYLVQPADARSLASGMARVLDAPETSAEMGERGHRLVAERYSATRMARLYEEVYGEIMGVSKKGKGAC